MLRLQWDPERYDYVSEHQLWCTRGQFGTLLKEVHTLK